MNKAEITYVIKAYREASLFMQFIVFYDTGVCRTYCMGTVPETVKQFMRNADWTETRNGRLVTVTYNND